MASQLCRTLLAQRMLTVGGTLNTVIGDLLSWTHTPTLELALRAYIIKSRVRDSRDLLLAEPYSPMLFRQGVQPGPHLLLQILQGSLTPEAAKAEWATFTKESMEAKTTGDTWIHRLKIPCRRCTDLNEGREVLRPVSAFANKDETKVEEVWREVLSHGQRACYLRCVRQLRLIRGDKPGDDTNMLCEACCRSRPQEFFSSSRMSEYTLDAYVLFLKG